MRGSVLPLRPDPSEVCFMPGRTHTGPLASGAARILATLAIAGTLAAHAAGCTGDGAPAGGSTVTDSAGIRIIDNVRPDRSDDEAWRVAGEPLLDLGGESSSAEFERIASVFPLPGGGLVVGDEGAATITEFGDDGGVRWQTGGSGDGPGEYRLIATLGPGPADSIWVFDFGSRRFTILDAAGTVARTVPADATISAPIAVGWLGNGTFVLRESWGSGGSAQPRTGMTREPAAVVTMTADGSAIDTLRVVPGREVWLTVENGRGVMNTPLFARNSTAATGGDLVAVADQAAFAIDVLDANGETLHSVRLAGVDVAIDDRMIGAAIDAQLAEIPEAERPARRTWLEQLPVPDARPAFDRILVAASGELWVSSHPETPADPVLWHVFDDSGRWLATVDVPDRFRLTSVLGDRLAGVWLDPFDVEHARVYRLVRPSAQSAR